MEQLNYKIGIIGPRSFITGGHCSSADIRVKLRDKMCQIINSVDSVYQIVGLTGLGIGCEQDFALVCERMDIPYSSYLPYENIEKKWITLPHEIENNFTYLLNNATGVLYVSNGPYSPKKIEKKNEKIIEDSDLVIYVKTPLSKYDYLINKGKNVAEIRLWEYPN